MALDLFGNVVQSSKNVLKSSVNKVKKHTINTGLTDKKKSVTTDDKILNLFLNKQIHSNGTKNGLSKNHIKILKDCAIESSAVELRKILGRTNSSKFNDAIIKPLIENNYLELTIPESPRSPKQKYRLTGKFVRNKI